MNALVGTGGLVRFILRRDRFLLAVWLLIITGVVLGGAGTTETTYPTAAARQERLHQVSNTPMFMLFQSRAYDSSVGALAAQQVFGGATIFAALGSVLFLIRHTRREEQAGRRELLGGTVVGRHAPLTAALIVVLGVGGLVALISALGLIRLGFPAAGSVALALVVGAAIWVSAALAAVVVQLTEHANAAAVSAFALFYGFHLVRGFGAIGGDSLAWLAWLVPNGWLQHVRPFADERWWVLGLVAGLIVVLIGTAYVLSGRRDLGAGLLPARLGAASAAPSLRTALGLAWRLQRRELFVWLVGTAVIAVTTGSIGASAMTAYAQGSWLNEYAARIGASRPADAFFVYVVFVMVFPIAAYAVMKTLFLRSEEVVGRAETVLATPVPRLRWALSHLVFALGVPLALLAVIGLGFGFGSGWQRGDYAGEIGRMLALTTSLVPAVWMIVGITLATFGLKKSLSAIVGWGALAIGIVAEIVVKMGVPEWVFLVLSPFAHVNPYYQPTAITLLTLTLIAAVLLGVGLVSLRHRDVG